MKKIYALFLAVMLSGTVFGQMDVYLNINHQLGTSPFQFNTAAMNTLNQDFDVSRLEYYISEITLIHDGGTETLVPNTWLLIDAGTATNEMLGSFNINSLEAIRFGIGVEAAVNHLDPSSYAASHPLAPQSPSMHWGWSAGYRFVAMEGSAGPQMNQNYEIHALDDDYYFLTTIPTNGTVNGSDLTVELNADYAMALKGISIASGPITHGGFGESITLLENFRDDVFTSATAVGVEEGLQNAGLTLAPNPGIAGNFVKVNWDGNSATLVQLYDLSGKLLREIPTTGQALSLEVSTPGYYLVAIVQEGQRVATRKLIVVE